MRNPSNDFRSDNARNGDNYYSKCLTPKHKNRMRLFKLLCRTDTKKENIKLVFTARQITFIAFFLSNRESKILNIKIEMLLTQIFRLLPKVKEYFYVT